MRLRARFLRVVFPLVQAYWQVRRPYFRGVRVVVRDGDDVLLIRHSYGSGAWGIPGGGLKRGEDPREAAIRETREETGLTLTAVEEVAGSPIDEPGADGDLWVFTGRSDSRDHVVDEVEILEARWFPVTALPERMLTQARRALALAGIE